MSDYETIQKWLNEKTFHSTDCRKNKIELGTLDLTIRLQQNQPDQNNPLAGVIESSFTESQQALFSVPEKYGQSRLGYIKKLAGTPFYHSYLIYSALLIDIIDFYSWGEYPALHRLFLVYDPEPGFELKLTFPSNYRIIPVRPNVVRAGNLFWSASTEVELNPDEQGLVFKTKQISNYSAVLAVTICLNDIPTAGNSNSYYFQLLKALSDRVTHHHINNNYCTNDRKIQSRLDDLWTAQKAITPDWKLPNAIRNDPLRHQIVLTWLTEFGLYFSHQDLLQDIYNALQQNLNLLKNNSRLVFLYYRLQNHLTESTTEQKKRSRETVLPVPEGNDPFQACLERREQPIMPGKRWNETQILYRSYFSFNPDDTFNSNPAQNYWNQISLPLFENKLERELKSNPEKIIILYLLGLYDGLPFTDILATHLDLKVNDPLLNLVVFLQQQIQKRCHSNLSYSFKEGSKKNHAVRELILFNQNSLRFTRHGKVSYVQFSTADNFHFRMDKTIHCLVDPVHRKFAVYPHVPVYAIHENTDRRIQVQIMNYLLSWPFLWPKAEMDVASVRFRWIFKKRRYQISLQKKKGNADLRVDNQSVVWPDTNKVVRYYEVKAGDPEIKLNILDTQGRTIPRQQTTSGREIQVMGWMKNRYNQLEDIFTYRYNNRQYSAGETGRYGIQTVLTIPADTKTLTIGIHGRQQVIEIPHYANRFWEKFLHYSSGAASGDLVVLIDAVLKMHLPYIQTFFDDYFAFQPRYVIKNRGVTPLACSVMIHLHAASEDFVIKQNRDLTAALYLELGVKKGIEQLHDLLSFIKNNLQFTAGDQTKRSDKA